MQNAIVFCLFVVSSLCVNRFVDDSALVRDKRQVTFYYLCGKFPHQYYATRPCGSKPPTCENGGRLIGVGCTNSVQCTPFHTGVTQCIKGCCCTVPEVPQPQPDLKRFGICYHGQLSESRCSGRGQCDQGQTCMNGLCCTTTGQEFEFACGGEAAISSCGTGGTCNSGMHCVSSNYCCECPVGQTSGKCDRNGRCPSGFSCQPNGFCCSQCPGNVMPFGECRNGTCGAGRKCYPGKICC